MSQKISWIDNLRALACMMVVMIHASTSLVVNFAAVNTPEWTAANVLNSASRVCVPLFFMISGALFLGERSAQKRHFLRVTLCLLFYSAVSLIYILTMTKIGFWPSLRLIMEKPVFYHLWFFYAIILIYLLSPLINVKAVSGRYLLIVAMLFGVLANPQLPAVTWHKIHLLPLDLYISGDTFYYVLYALLGRAISQLRTEKAAITLVASAMFILSTLAIATGTYRQMQINQSFADTFYIYSGPLVFISAMSLFVVFKNTLAQRLLPGFSLISRHSLAIYGFHALIITGLRGRHLDFPQYPLLNLVFLFICGLGGGLFLAMGLGKIDRRNWVS
ncbi:acyltransferase [Rahnella sp. C60]|uniref:acyltransferase n=1 Tax=Rahnella perminowiae TaxID=2816244 RepID=UPI001C262890|nr:acyltransferase [Rahnella perminowiae]MBU9817410.1 acyltransferase [Rahnella perminowiae]